MSWCQGKSVAEAVRVISVTEVTYWRQHQSSSCRPWPRCQLRNPTHCRAADGLGHKTLQMVKRYVHLSESHLKELVERVNDKILPAQL